MRLLVTGGCGFIGSNFIQDILSRDPDLTIVNLDKLTYAGNLLNLKSVSEQYGGTRYHFVHGDIADPQTVNALFKDYAIDAVANFAAETHVDRSIEDSAPFVTTNVLGTQVLLEAAKAHQVKRFLQVSTDEVYGSLGPTGRFTEKTPLQANSPYSASKAGGDLLVRAYHETYQLPTVITRCSNNYGPYQFPEKLIPLMILKAGRDETLPVYGDGLNVRDWIYVIDHCRGVELALRQGRDGAVYNFGGDAEKTNLEVVKAVLDLMAKPHSLISLVKDRPGHDRRYAMDSSLAARELGWKPEMTFEKGIQKTLAWYQENPEWIEGVTSGAYLEFMRRQYGDPS